MKTTIFNCQLPDEIQAKIETAIVSYLKVEGYKCTEPCDGKEV